MGRCTAAKTGKFYKMCYRFSSISKTRRSLNLIIRSRAQYIYHVFICSRFKLKYEL